MKDYAVAKSIAVFQESIKYSKWDAHVLKNGNWLAVLSSPRLDDVERAEAAGAVFLPVIEDPEATATPEFIAMIPKEAGLAPTDTVFRVAKKLFAHTNWPPHRPTRR